MSGLTPQSELSASAERSIAPIAQRFVGQPPIPADLAVTMELPAYDAWALFEATCEQADIGIAHLRADETWQWVNQRFCDIVGYPREELMALRLEDITHPDDLAATLENARRARLGALPSYTLEKRYVRKDGTTVWGSLTVSTVRTSPNAPAYFVGFLQDITARRRAEQRLAAQHAASRLLSEAKGGQLPKGLMEAVCRALGWDAAILWTVDWSDDLLLRTDEWVSPRARTAEHAARLFALTVGQELPGRVWSSGEPVWIADLGRETTSPHTHRAADAGLHGAVVFPVESSSICGVIELYSAEVQPPDRELLRTLAVIGGQIAHVLDHARTEDVVREAEALKTAIVDTTLDCVITIDANSRIVEFNPAAERTFGYRRTDVIGKSMPDLIIPPAFRERHKAGFARYLAMGSTRVLAQRREFMAMRADGTEFPIELTATRIPVPGAPVFTAFIRDITERKEAERELQSSVSLLRSTLEATSEGVLVVSNDGMITSHNKRMTQMWGIPEGILATRRDSLVLSYAARKLKHPEQFMAKTRELYADREAESFDVLEMLDGRIIERTSRPQRIAGESVGRVWSFRDVTESRRAEEALRESEQRFRSLTEAAVDGVLIHEGGVIIDANPSFCRMFGYELQELLGQNVFDLLVVPEKRDMTMARSRAGDAAVYETEGFRKDRTRLIIEVSGRPATIRGRTVRVAAIHDVTERKHAEEAVRESEERFRSLTEAAMEGVLIHENGIILDANPSLCALTGYTLAELVGQNTLDLIVAPESRELVAKRMRSGATEMYEMVGLRKDGSKVIVEISSRGATYRGRSARVVAIHDVTERKQAEEATLRLLEEQAARSAAESAERRARFLAEASRVLGASFDYHTTLATLARLAVPAFADFCTVDMLEADDRIARVGVAHVDPEKEPMLFELARRFGDRGHAGPAALHLQRAVMAGASTLVPEVDREMLLAAGVSDEHRALIMDLLPCSLLAVPLRLGERTIGVLSLLTSESGRHFGPDDLALAEELARRASLAVENARLFHAAEQATRARDEMLGVVAHDLRNPLSTITMVSQLLLEAGSPERTTERKQLEIMRRAAERMKRLISDLLDAKRIESGGLNVDPRAEEVTTVVGDAVEMLRPLATSSSLQLDAAVPDGLPRVMVDPARVQQVLSNLIGNAIKFTPAGGSISVRAELAEDGVCLAVVDTGPGIPTEQLPHIFSHFWQGKRTDRRGVGLGLAIAKAIVEAHQGRIWVESQVGAGTSFYFTVPVVS
jgi:PAS domain S-box-containing protein